MENINGNEIENNSNRGKSIEFGEKLNYMLKVMLATISDERLKWMHSYLELAFATVSKEMVKWPEEKTKEFEKKLDDILELMSSMVSKGAVKCTEEGAKAMEKLICDIITPIFGVVGKEMEKVKWTEEDKEEVKKIEKMGYLKSTKEEIKEAVKIVNIWSKEKAKEFEKELNDILKPILATVSEEMENRLGNPIDKELVRDTRGKLSEIRDTALKNLKSDNKNLISELEKDLVQLRCEGRFVANKVLKYEVVTAKSKVIENVFVGVVGKYDNETKKYEGGRLHELGKWVSRKNTLKQNKIDKKPRTEKDEYYEKKGK